MLKDTQVLTCSSHWGCEEMGLALLSQADGIPLAAQCMGSGKARASLREQG